MRDRKFLSRRLLIKTLSEEREMTMSILETDGTISESLPGVAPLRIEMKNYRLSRYTTEIPGVEYFGTPLKLTESEKGIFLLTQ